MLSQRIDIKKEANKINFIKRGKNGFKNKNK